MKLRWTETIVSGARMLPSSGQRSLGEAAEMSEPIPPSATIGGPSRSRSRKLAMRRTVEARVARRYEGGKLLAEGRTAIRFPVVESRGGGLRPAAVVRAVRHLTRDPSQTAEA